MPALSGPVSGASGGGMTSFWPTRIRFGSVMSGFAASSWPTVRPNRCAMALRLSPDTTTYVCGVVTWVSAWARPRPATASGAGLGPSAPRPSRSRRPGRAQAPSNAAMPRHAAARVWPAPRASCGLPAAPPPKRYSARPRTRQTLDPTTKNTNGHARPMLPQPTGAQGRHDQTDGAHGAEDTLRRRRTTGW